MSGWAPPPKPKVDYARLETIGRDLLTAIGENPDRRGLAETPKRFARAWQEFIEYDPGKVETAFESVSADQMVVVSGMRVWSLCEHHLLPFWCDVSIGYIPEKRVLGLSKFARIAHLAAHRLQLQERLVEDIANAVRDLAQTQHVAVLATGEHGCMVMRGVRTPGLMTSSVMRGRFRESDAARAEFLQIIRR